MTYTVEPGMGLKLGVTERTAEILRNVAAVLITPLGSVPLYRGFGLDMSFLDKPETIAESLMVAPVREAVERWEPRARVVSVKPRRDPSAPGKLIPVVEVKIEDE